MDGANPCCSQNYATQVYKHFPKLRALDGYRKACGTLVNMKEALPEIQDDNITYNTAGEQWYDEKALEESNPEKGKFDKSAGLQREENILQNMLNEC